MYILFKSTKNKIIVRFTTNTIIPFIAIINNVLLIKPINIIRKYYLSPEKAKYGAYLLTTITVDKFAATVDNISAFSEVFSMRLSEKNKSVILKKCVDIAKELKLYDIGDDDEDFVKSGIEMIWEKIKSMLPTSQ